MKVDLCFRKCPGCGLYMMFLAFFFLPVYITAQQTQALASFKDANDKYGFKNKSGQIVIPAKYQSVAGFSNKLAAVKFNDKWGFIDTTGKEVIPIKYQSVDNFYQGFAKAKFNDKWGMIDSTGKEVVPIKYQDIGFFNESLAPVKLNDKWGFVDKTGKVIIPTKYQSLYLGFQEGLDAVQLNDKWGFIDKTGKEIIPMKYQSAENFDSGLAKAKLNDKWGFIDKTGKEIVPFKYQDALAFKDGWAKVKSSDKWGAVDKTGSEIIPTRYDEIFHINVTEGLAKVKLDKKWGAVDKAGNEVIAIKYEDLYPYFFENLATVKWNGKWGFIDRAGKEVIPAKYDDSRNFSDGLALVRLNWSYGLIDKTGREVVPIKYDNIHGFSDGLAAVQFNKKWGFVDKTGKEVIPPQYDYAHEFSGGKALVTKDGKDYTITKPLSSNSDNSVLAIASGNPSAGTVRQPPLAMKGIIDPAVVGTWKYHNDAPSFNGFYIFRADGTYDYYSDMITPNPPTPSYKNFWRVDGEEMEIIIDGKNQVLRQKVLRRNDPQTNKPALLIPWDSATQEYRAYYPTQAHDLWKTATSSQKSNSSSAANPVAAVKMIDPPVRLTGNVDLSVVGLWKCNYNKIDYWLDLKADGTYNTYSATNSKPAKCYWRINGDYIETFCEGAKQMSRFVFRKLNDLNNGKPTITLDGVAYFPETDKEMWKGM